MVIKLWLFEQAEEGSDEVYCQISLVPENKVRFCNFSLLLGWRKYWKRKQVSTLMFCILGSMCQIKFVKLAYNNEVAKFILAL